MTVKKLEELRPDPKNLRKHSPRNIATIAAGLREIGAARSIVVDENDVVLAGNGVVEAAALAGITKVKIVEADGKTLIAVKRTGLREEEKTRLAIYDNRASELSEWDSEAMAQLAQTQAQVLNGLFTSDEMKKLIALLPRAQREEYQEQLPDLGKVAFDLTPPREEGAEPELIAPEGVSLPEKFSPLEVPSDDVEENGDKKDREDRTYHIEFMLSYEDSLIVKRALEECPLDANQFLVGACSAYIRGIWNENS